MARLRPLPYREVERRLRAAGFERVCQKGSHVKFLRQDLVGVRTAIVPRRREVPIGTLGLLNAQPMGFYSPNSLVQDALRNPGLIIRGTLEYRNNVTNLVARSFTPLRTDRLQARNFR